MLSEHTLSAMNRHTEFYERAATLNGRPRERMVALGEADELYFRLYPHHYRALQIVRVVSQLGRAVHRRRGPLQRCESRAVGLLTSVISDAMAVGDLQLRAPRRPDDLAFSVWAMVYGARALMNTAAATRQLGVQDGYVVARDTVELLFDALGWRPLSNEWDYEKTRERIRKEIFAREWPDASAA